MPESEGLVMVCDVDIGVPDATRTHTLEVARGFAAEGFDVDLVTRGPDPKLDGVRHLRIVSPLRPRIARFLSLNSRTISLLRARRGSAARLYVRSAWPVLPILVAGRALGYRVVTQVDDMPFGRGFEREINVFYDYFRRASAWLMGRLAHGIVAVTPQLKELLVELFHVPPERVAVLPNGVDTDFIRPVPRHEAMERVGFDPSLHYVLFCGNLASWVDLDLLVDAFARVARERSDARLIVVGSGTQEERLHELVARAGLQDRVVMTGFVEDRSRVRDYLGASTVGVTAHATDYINRIGVSPTKLAEYMAAGRAVVVRRVPGLSELVESAGCGLAVSDAAEMADALLSLLDPERADQLGANGRRLAEERLTWPSVVHRTVPLFGLDRPVAHTKSGVPVP